VPGATPLSRTLHLLLPGSLDTPTGGYVYDRHIVQGLRDLGWRVEVRQLDGSFPFPTQTALAAAMASFAALPDGALVLVDGLALGALPEIAEREAARLRLVALVHHPLALETGLDEATAAALESSERRALAVVRHVVVTSPRTATTLQDWALTATRISVVEPGVDQPAKPAAARTREAAVRLLCVATLTERKGHALLLEALAPLAGLPWQLRCIGSRDRSPATTTRLEAQVAALGLQERVLFEDDVPQAALRDAYAAADLFVLPTLYEGFGMVVAEAIASGLPVVATATGAIPALVPADAGVVVPTGDVAALRAALARLLADAGQLESFAQGARRAAATARSWETAAREMSSLLAAQAES
jgi:glycosyltransferase involved in cell wall biosynthesis